MGEGERTCVLYSFVLSFLQICFICKVRIYKIGLKGERRRAGRSSFLWRARRGRAELTEDILAHSTRLAILEFSVSFLKKYFEVTSDL